jgi:type I restriction enzyme S subunit
MNAERLLAQFERISEAPDAIARLRRFILDLAVRGKLVEQDPEDEPAEELLKRIAVEKVRLVKAGEMKRGKVLPPIEEDKLSFDLPSAWAFTRLGDLIHLVSGQHLQPHEYTENSWDGLPYITGPSDFADEGLRISRFALVRKAVAKKGQLLLTVKGSGVGKATTCNLPEVAISRQLMALMAIGWDDRFLILIANRLAVQLRNAARSLIPGISREDVEEFAFPLPPLAEQHRIVAKVDELMALCDQLEAARQKREQGRERLVASTLQRLNQPAEDPASFRKDASFALQVLPSLTTTSAQIKQLRQTILNLAVRGKLVEQDPEDEPAEELLARFAEAKIEIKRATGDARIKVADDACPDSLPMSLPPTWECQSFQNLFLFIDYRGNTPPKTTDGVPLITAKNVRMGYLDREPREYVSPQTLVAWMTRGLPRLGDLFFTTEAPLGNVCINNIDEPFALAQRVICLQPYSEISTRFVMYTLMSSDMQEMIEAQATGLTAKGIKAAKLKPLPIPLPPLAEQRRIVAKVDTLLALCDQLERQLSQADQQRRRLLEAVLAEALGGRLPTGQEESHAAIA